MKSIILTVVSVLLAFAGGMDRAASQSSLLVRENLAESTQEPMTIAASCVGLFGDESPWYISVNSSGQASLTVDMESGPRTRQLEISQEELKKIRTLVTTSEFAEYANDFGTVVFDGSTESTTIVIGESSRTIRLKHISEKVVNACNDKDLTKLTAALEIQMLIRGWFEDRFAVDSRPHIRRLRDVIDLRRQALCK